MNDKDGARERHFKALAGQVSQALTAIDLVDKTFEDDGRQPPSHVNSGGTLANYAEDYPKEAETYNQLQRSIAGSRTALKTVESYILTYKANLKEEIQQQRAFTKAERKDMWLLWIQKTTRWALGFAVAIILYSGAVWLSEKYPDFIKVPVRDWIKTQNAAEASGANFSQKVSGSLDEGTKHK